jgi:hypothetical protein
MSSACVRVIGQPRPIQKELTAISLPYSAFEADGRMTGTWKLSSSGFYKLHLLEACHGACRFSCLLSIPTEAFWVLVLFFRLVLVDQISERLEPCQ